MIYCVACSAKVEARLTFGKEIYPHRKDLADLPFWKCDTCGNYVGCHHKTDTPTRPLGNIPTPELRKARMKLHEMIDPLWKDGRISRKRLYSHLSGKLGREYHTAETRSVAEVNSIIAELVDLATSLAKSYDRRSTMEYEAEKEMDRDFGLDGWGNS